MLPSVYAFPDHLTLQVLLSWTIGVGGQGSADILVTNIFQQIKNPPRLKYNDQKRGTYLVKPGYRVSLDKINK